MNIPDKYRDRYDRLALSHPWMREMRDEPTETIEPVEKLRDWSKWLDCVYATDDGKAYCVYNYKPYDGMKSCGEYMRDLADAIDDMIERDYVLRRIFDAVCAERDEWRARAEAKSAKRAVAVERLRALPKLNTARKILSTAAGIEVRQVTEERDVFIDLLTDDDANDDLPPDSDVSATDADANDVIAKQARAIADLGKQVDSLIVRAVGAEQEADELKVIVDRLKRENAALAADLAESESLRRAAEAEVIAAKAAKDYWRGLCDQKAEHDE